MSKQASQKSQVVTLASACDDTFFTPEALSALLGMPKKTLAAWRTQRKGPLFYRMGVHVRYPKVYVDTWLAECEAQALKWMQS